MFARLYRSRSARQGSFTLEVRMNHKQAGINKGVSEAVYPKDILGDTALKTCTLRTRGAWYECLLHMWHDRTCEITTTYPGFARLWGCELVEAKQIIDELKITKPCNVTVSNLRVTLTSRRLQRRHKDRKDAANRQKKHREEQTSPENNKDVQPEKTTPSSSLSSSPSISSSKDKKKRVVFIPPTSSQVEEYAKTINYNIDGNGFVDSYEQKGWMVGKNKMVSWKAAVRNWKTNGWGLKSGNNGGSPKDIDYFAKLDYAKSLNAMRDAKDDDGISKLFTKIRDNFGPGAVDVVKKEARSQTKG